MPSTSFAVMTKARAKFGKRLTEKDYQNLILCQSVPEIMVYLKSNTHYSKALFDVDERDIHRGILEALLRQDNFAQFDSLCRYDSSVSSGLAQLAIQRKEVEQLVRFLILLNSNSTEKFIYQFPAYFDKHTEIDIDRLANAKTYDEMLSVLSNTPYCKVLAKFSPGENEQLRISEIETALQTLIYENIDRTIKKKANGSEKQELLELFTTINDYEVFSRILRLKKYYEMDSEAIKNNLQLSMCNIKPKSLDMMCKADSSAEVFSIMQTTHEGKLINKIGYVYASDIAPRVKYRIARKNIHFSNNPSVVMISYMFLSEIELLNVITIIEGIRYKLDKQKIQSLLIY